MAHAFVHLRDPYARLGTMPLEKLDNHCQERGLKLFVPAANGPGKFCALAAIACSGERATTGMDASQLVRQGATTLRRLKGYVIGSWPTEK